ncbi:hypothetical protein NLR85_24380 [Escherichia coli]|nr:hypothetical protein [Escherichia coli]
MALMSGSAFAVTHHAFSSGAGRTSDGNGSHASTLKSPSYTKSVSWQHYLGIEPLNPMIRQDLILGYIVVVRNGKASQEINGLLNRSLPKAISTFKDHINEYEAAKSKMR